MKMVIIVSSLVMSFALNAQTIQGKVVRVANGDATTILDSTNVQNKVRFLGIEVGGTLDVHDKAVRDSLGLKEPSIVTLANEKFTYYECDSKCPRDGYDEYFVDVSTNKVVLGLVASIKCRDKEETKSKVSKVCEELKKEFGDRIAPLGEYCVWVSNGDNYVDVNIQKAKFKDIVERNNNPKSCSSQK